MDGEAKRAYYELIDILLGDLSLVNISYRKDRDLVIFSDASKTAGSAIIYQKQACGNYRMLDNFSVIWSSVERGYNILRLEAKAMVLASQYWRYWLMSDLEKTWFTDNRALFFISQDVQKHCNSAFGIFLHDIQELFRPIRLLWLSGVDKSFENVDLLSRLPIKEKQDRIDAELLAYGVVNPKKLKDPVAICRRLTEDERAILCNQKAVTLVMRTIDREPKRKLIHTHKYTKNSQNTVQNTKRRLIFNKSNRKSHKKHIETPQTHKNTHTSSARNLEVASDSSPKSTSQPVELDLASQISHLIVSHAVQPTDLPNSESVRVDTQESSSSSTTHKNLSRGCQTDQNELNKNFVSVGRDQVYRESVGRFIHAGKSNLEQAKVAHQRFHLDPSSMHKIFEIPMSEANYIRSQCQVCFNNIYTNSHIHSESKIRTPLGPLHTVSLDVAHVEGTHNLLIAGVDLFSKFVFLEILGNQTSESIFCALCKMFRTTGFPKFCRFDNNAANISESIKQHLADCGSILTTVCSLNPNASPIERNFNTIKNFLKKSSTKPWYSPLSLYECQNYLNHTKCSGVSSHTPHQLMFHSHIDPKRIFAINFPDNVPMRINQPDFNRIFENLKKQNDEIMKNNLDIERKLRVRFSPGAIIRYKTRDRNNKNITREGKIICFESPEVVISDLETKVLVTRHVSAVLS